MSGDISGGAGSLSFYLPCKNQRLFLSTEALAAARLDESYMCTHVCVHTHTIHVKHNFETMPTHERKKSEILSGGNGASGPSEKCRECNSGVVTAVK